ncbi:putative pfkB family carbohydrate kinase [Trypanosoma vivax]|uniref:Adenosine kinase n=1 Tax=Trypanosoma vivax (strain Y486) TaxID=1055687 RepID=G0TWQ6_TRYVY|nr:putative pfkB family carbohydrate kinase [Trypanosoma vivax]CCC48394.1 putative adenosine kinase [Trypanosoma vivax Y486]
MADTLSRFYVQCNPLLDILAHVPDEFMKRYGVEVGSIGLMKPEQQGIFADLEKMPSVRYLPGGSGLNTARVAQWMRQAPKGTFATYVGCIADDRYGKMLKEAAEHEGLTMVVEHTTKDATGSCAVCINSNERALVANLAAANCLSAEHMNSAAVEHALQNSAFFYLTGFTLTIDVNHVLKVAKKAREVNGVFSMNLSAPFIMEFFSTQLRQVLPEADIIFSNECEALAFAKMNNWDTLCIKEIARRTFEEVPYVGNKGRIVIITQGANETVVASRDGVMGVPVPPLDQNLILDKNGAGDAFVGGFMSVYIENGDIIRSCEAGHYAAQVVIQHDGCTFPDKPSFI